MSGTRHRLRGESCSAMSIRESIESLYVKPALCFGRFYFLPGDTGDGVPPGARWYRGFGATGRGVVSGVGRHQGRSGIEGGVKPAAEENRRCELDIGF